MKNFLKLVFVTVFAAIAGYGIYANQKVNTVSDLMLANVDALASSNEYEPDNECSGCIMNCLYVCKTFGDWGGCIGDPYVHRT